MREAGIVLVTVLALTAAGALVTPPGRDLRVRVRLRQPPRPGMGGFAYRRPVYEKGTRITMGPAGYLDNRL
jgi:hypothetical protein